MDNIIKTIDTLRLVRECVKRDCFDCSECDVNLPSEDVIKALNTAIALLDAQRNIKDVIEGRL